MIRLLSYNMAKRPSAWEDVISSGADVAMLQEFANPSSVNGTIRVDGEPWQNKVEHHEHVWRNGVAALSDDVTIRWFKPHIAEVIPADGQPLIVMSLYALWQKPDSSTGSSWIYADASAHRLISDLSAFVGSVRGHRVIAAGDLNIFRGYGDKGSPYWKARYDSVFDRMAALGLRFMGPRQPNGRPAQTLMSFMPEDTKNVPTYYHNTETIETATHQLDFVFASESIADRVSVRALNGVEEWGRSDHCRVVIEVAD